MRMSRTMQRDNSRELSLRSELHRRGLRFRLHRKLNEGSRRTVDIAFPSQKVAVFLDGCFWHGCSKHGTWPKNNADWWRAKIEANVARDRDTNTQLKKAGWAVVRVWEHDDIVEAANRVERTIRAQSHSAKTRP
jgi:DNA mismatch endonuclease, patch repair protein